MKTKILFLFFAFVATMNSFAGSYAEFKISTVTGADPGSMKMYYQDGNSRTEMEWNSPSMPGGGVQITNLILSSEPNKTYNLNEKEKTYSVADWSAHESTVKNQEYEVTVVGEEKVNGYNSVHVKLKRKSSQTGEDLWLSKDVSNYEVYRSINSKYTTNEMFKSLKEKGVDGFPVRISTSERGHNFQMDLVKAETRKLDASLFSLTGYKKSESPAGVNSDMIQKYQNMSPEERQKMIEQMKQQYQKPGNK